MSSPEKSRDIAIALSTAVCALLVLFVWIPADIDTGVIDVWRRTIRIGDAMLPTVAAIGCLVGCIGLIIQAMSGKQLTYFKPVSWILIFQTVVILSVSILLFRYTGPVLASLWFGDTAEYRQLLNEIPWKFVGFLSGGTFMVFSFISVLEQCLRWKVLVWAICAAVFIALLYDLPFDNILLPPNGDF